MESGEAHCLYTPERMSVGSFPGNRLRLSRRDMGLQRNNVVPGRPAGYTFQVWSIIAQPEIVASVRASIDFKASPLDQS